METITQCPLCGGAQYKPFYSGIDRYFSGKQVSYVGCQQCSLIFLQPRPSAQEYKEMYESVFQDKRRGIETKAQAIHRLQKKGSLGEKQKEIQSIQEFIQSGDSYLEIGAGWGTLAKVVHDMCGAKVEIVEPSRLASEVAREYYGLNVFQGDFDNFITQTSGEKKYDVIALWHVFEHLLDPNDFLKKAKNLLKPGGKLIMAMPDVSKPDEPSEKFFHIEHCFYYSPSTLTSMLQKHGFNVVKLSQDPHDMKVVAISGENVVTPNSFSHELDDIQKNIRRIDRRYRILRGFKNMVYKFLSPEQKQKMSQRMSAFLRKVGIIKV